MIFVNFLKTWVFIIVLLLPKPSEYPKLLPTFCLFVCHETNFTIDREGEGEGEGEGERRQSAEFIRKGNLIY